jgi:hypothetical protein
MLIRDDASGTIERRTDTIKHKWMSVNGPEKAAAHFEVILVVMHGWSHGHRPGPRAPLDEATPFFALIFLIGSHATLHIGSAAAYMHHG